MIENPIFIVGTERSGSNLLRLLLNEMPGIAIPHPPHILRDLTPRLELYGDLKQEKNFIRLADTVARFVDLHFAPWPITLDRKRLVEEAKSRTLYALYAGAYEQYLEHTGKSRWGCKSTFMIHNVADILAHHKEPQFIHLVRDVRDVAVSARKSIFSHYHPYFVAQLWQREQALAQSWSAQLGSETWLTLRYEDLIQAPEEKMRQLSRFLKTRYNSKWQQFFDRPANRELSSLSRSWQNLSQPVMTNNRDKFQSELNAKEIQSIESVAWREMELFHYRTLQEPIALHNQPTPFELAKFRAAEDWMRLKEESLALWRDRNATARWRKRAYLLALPWSQTI